ncbi:6-phosphogluconate phosphatase [mine drainage metagenome]|uniref:6-phosphogluconate phosphatase n=1 Tax=mine drainage metagenome TaxID=410659 RepID=A0A1J5Q1A3_9ZZZZ
MKVVEEHLGRSLASDWEDTYQHLYREAYVRELQPVDGIIEALDEIKLPTCVASSGSHEKTKLTLGLTGLWPHFAGRIFSASEVKHGKPAPDLFLHAASVLGHEAVQCVVVEDSAPGVQGALAAGMKVIAYAGGVTPRERLEGSGVHLIDNMSQLPHAVSVLLNQRS